VAGRVDEQSSSAFLIAFVLIVLVFFVLVLAKHAPESAKLANVSTPLGASAANAAVSAAQRPAVVVSIAFSLAARADLKYAQEWGSIFRSEV
jgi:hypothetical protein